MAEKDKKGGFTEMLQGIKKADSIKQDFVNRNLNSTDPQARSMAETFKKQLDNDTTVMLETGDNKGRRVNSKGKIYGPEMQKEDSGLYINEFKPVKKAKGGMIKSSASKRADGCATKGKTRGRMV